MKKNFKISLSDPMCVHHEDCGCSVSLEGISAKTLGLKATMTEGNLTRKYQDLSIYIDSTTVTPTGETSSTVYLEDSSFLKASVPAGSTVTLISPPIPTPATWPESIRLYALDPRVTNSLKRADLRFIRFKYPNMYISWAEMQRWVWSEDVAMFERRANLPVEGPVREQDLDLLDIPPLLYLCIRTQSMYHWACGATNGRAHVVSAMADLWPRKFARAIAAVARPQIGDRAKEPLQFLNEALDNMYRMMKIDLSEKEKVTFSFKMLQGMYLGASNGCTPGKKKTIDPTDDVPHPIKVSPKGKKIDSFEQDLTDILTYLRTGKEPSIYWETPPKCENFFEFFKQYDDIAWEKFVQKVRVFCIPSGIYIHLERLVSTLRHLKERGVVIQVGRPWSHGGMDAIARCLGVNRDTAFIPSIVEGDGKQFDQSVRDFFIDLYFSTMNTHLHPESPDYDMFEMITRFLLKNMLNRITRLFGDVWGIVHGGVPSGAYNTSHMDSWIMALYFCLFCVYQVHTAPESDQEELELEMITIIKIVVYGDDHLYQKGTGLGSVYFSGVAFADFMEKHFGVLIRDLKDGIPFCSEVKDGWLVKMGATMLKHQAVINPDNSKGQPAFLPYRESREFLIRSVWGRETRPRDVIDTLLSLLGHAYGTYASNRDAYDRMYCFYSELLMEVDLDNLDREMASRLGHDDLKKLRQVGLSVEELVSGFPDWDTLLKKNIWDPVYQDISKIAFDTFEPILGPGELF